MSHLHWHGGFPLAQGTVDAIWADLGLPFPPKVAASVVHRGRRNSPVDPLAAAKSAAAGLGPANRLKKLPFLHVGDVNPKRLRPGQSVESTRGRSEMEQLVPPCGRGLVDSSRALMRQMGHKMAWYGVHSRR